jgi:O-antigen/teichoic acid export membrane protein
MDTVNRVALPTLSRLRAGAQGLRAVHTRLLGVTAAYAFIACWGLAAIADGLIPVLLGERWRAVAGLLEVLAIIAPLRMVSAVQNTIATALGAPQAVTKELLLASLLLPAVLMAGASTGDVLLAAKAWASAYPLVYLASTWLTASAVGMPLLACLRPIAAPLCAGVMLLATVLAVETLLAPYLHAVVLIGVSVALGALSYGLSLALLSPRTYAEARRLLSDLGRRAKPSHP